MYVDLTPFGFTPTESLVYGALLEQGASSGYGLGKSLSLARANVYQALHGLVAKQAAVVAQKGPPREFRAVSPKVLLALATQRESELLERLEQQVAAQHSRGAETVMSVSGRRSFEQLALRTATRPSGLVQAAAPSEILQSLVPIWRKRAADGSPTHLWSIGEHRPENSLKVEGNISLELVIAQFGGPVSLLTTPDAALAGRLADGTFAGYWSSDPLLVAVIATAISQLVSASSP